MKLAEWTPQEFPIRFRSPKMRLKYDIHLISSHSCDLLVFFGCLLSPFLLVGQYSPPNFFSEIRLAMFLGFLFGKLFPDVIQTIRPCNIICLVCFCKLSCFSNGWPQVLLELIRIEYSGLFYV